MNTKPISPTAHGIIDYNFSAALFAVPRMLKLGKKAKRFYTINALNTLLYSAATNYPVALKRIIPYKLHRKIDIANTAMLILATLYKPVHKNKRALIFHISMITAAIVTISLTDWNAES